MSSGITRHTVVVPGALGRPEHLRRPYYRLTSGRGSSRLSFRGCGDTAKIGSHPANDLVLPQEAVSRFHARLELDAIGYRLVDLESTNGTWVGGLRIGSAYIEHKSRLRFGDVDVSFEVERDAVDLPLEAADRWGAVLGRSPVMRRLFEQLGQVARTASTVLLTGETGVGKDLLANEVHERSGRHGAFVVVDCGALPESLIHSELFGHERGAFTGADVARAGAFEVADGGTLFLDEIGELPLAVQATLLRAIESRKVKRVGSERWREVDVRLVVATHRDLARMCNQRMFREDLFYRISVVALAVPPLRDRTEDIPLLAQSFSQALGGEGTIDAASLDALCRQRWPGNVRELRNLIERAVAVGGGDGLAPDVKAALPEEDAYKVAKARAIEAFDRTYLEALLLRHRGNVAQAARAAQVDAAWIFRLVKRYGIDLTTLRRG